MRRLVVFSLLLVALGGCRGERPERAVLALARPNILILMAEDMSSRVHAFGDAVAQTPNLDRLAAEGTRFPNTFTSSGVCATSRAALITGMPQNAIGAGHMRTLRGGPIPYTAVPPPAVKAFPELLRRAGYWTFNDGKTDYGFSDGPLAGSGPRTLWDENSFLGGYDWRSAPADRPFFGMVNFGITHESGLFPMGWPRNGMHAVMLPLLWLRQRDVQQISDPADVVLPPFYPDTPLVRRTIARQYDHISTMDREVGAVLARLTADGLADSTIVIWTTDHGSGLPGYKREISDRGIHVPMIIRWPERFRPPGLAPGSIDERLVSFVDLAPQILAWAGVAAPANMVGHAFAGPAAGPPRRYVFAARDRLDIFADRARSVRDDSFLYIRNWFPEEPGFLDLAYRNTIAMMGEWRELYAAGKLDAVQAAWFEPRGAEELYDVRTDPHQVRNLAGDPQYAAPLARMRGALNDWLGSYDDLGAIPETELARRFYPDGEQPQTREPAIILAPAPSGSLAMLQAPDAGASIVWRRTGAQRPEHWELYVAPVALADEEEMEAIAVRYGWAESDPVSAQGRLD
ncbi:MAG: sulfatase [Deltaproteobacteria bacterium]